MLDYPVTLEVTETGVQQTVEGFCCGDRDRKRLRISLLLQGRKIALSPYCAAAFTAVKPDNTEISHPCTVEDGDICYVPAAQTLAEPGTLTCRIVVFGSDESVLYAPQFALTVEREEVGSETVVSADEHLLLPIHVLRALADADGALLYRDMFAGKVEIAQTFADLPSGSTGQLAYVRTADADHPRGFYRFGTQWESLPADTHTHANRSTLDALHAENGFLYCGSAAVGGICVAQSIGYLPADVPDGQIAYVQSTGRLLYRKSGNWYIAVQNHTHANAGVLEKLGVDADGYLTLDGERIDGGSDDDTLVPLSLGTAYASLQIRSDWTNVPVYLTDGVSYKFGLQTGADTAENMIRVYESKDFVTGLPCPMLRVKRGENAYTCIPRSFTSVSGTVSPGWYDAQGNAVSAPSLDNMTFGALDVCGTKYTDLSDLPAKAQLALETLSRIFNVSADAMGSLGVREDAVQRFQGVIEPGGKYAFSPADTAVLTLPVVPWTTQDAQFVLYLSCSADADFTFPSGTLFAGGEAPNTDAGEHKLIGSWLPDAEAWAVGGVDYAEATA